MIQTDNMYPNTARLYAADFTGNADLPYDFFMSRYKEAYKQETLAFVDALVNDKPSPCSGEDGLVALIMAITAGKSAASALGLLEKARASVQCDENGCMIVDLDDMAIAAAEKDSPTWIGKNVNRVLGKKGGGERARANARVKTAPNHVFVYTTSSRVGGCRVGGV